MDDPKPQPIAKDINKGIAVIRYADDFVITAPTREVLETYARPRMEKFLQERGLALSEAKTRIVHITEGFNFLGFHIRKFGKQGTLLTVPQKEKVLKHVRAIRSYLDAHKQTPAVAGNQGHSTRSYGDGRTITDTVQPNTSFKRSDMPNGRCSGFGRNADTRIKAGNG